MRFDEDHQWIEMRLRASSAQKVRLMGLGVEASPSRRARSCAPRSPPKFTADGIRAELDRSGFVVDHQYGAEAGEFLLTLAHPYC